MTNVIFARCVLGKVVTLAMYAGTAIIVGGVILTVWSASVVGDQPMDFPLLVSLWHEVPWIIYLVLIILFGVVLQTTHQVYVTAKASGKPKPYSDFLLPMTYATFSALFGTFSVVFAKILSKLLTLQFTGTPVREPTHSTEARAGRLSSH